jgi:glutamate synthase domain-containing protein 3
MSPKIGDSSPARSNPGWPPNPAANSDGGQPGTASTTPPTVIDVPDVRDYQRINAEVVQRLDQGLRHVRLIGVEAQRLLLAGVTGSWSALIEIEGNAGPELAFGLDSPGLRVVCLGSAADGVGSGLIDGQLLILGAAGACVGMSQRGGRITIAGPCADRAGLNQSGGSLMLLGQVGALAGERQAGGILLVADRPVGNHPGRGRRGGQFLSIRDDANLLNTTLNPFRQWLTPELLAGLPDTAIP